MSRAPAWAARKRPAGSRRARCAKPSGSRSRTSRPGRRSLRRPRPRRGACRVPQPRPRALHGPRLGDVHRAALDGRGVDAGLRRDGRGRPRLLHDEPDRPRQPVRAQVHDQHGRPLAREPPSRPPGRSRWLRPVTSAVFPANRPRPGARGRPAPAHQSSVPFTPTVRPARNGIGRSSPQRHPERPARGLPAVVRVLAVGDLAAGPCSGRPGRSPRRRRPCRPPAMSSTRSSRAPGAVAATTWFDLPSNEIAAKASASSIGIHALPTPSTPSAIASRSRAATPSRAPSRCPRMTTWRERERLLAERRVEVQPGVPGHHLEHVVEEARGRCRARAPGGRRARPTTCTSASRVTRDTVSPAVGHVDAASRCTRSSDPSSGSPRASVSMVAGAGGGPADPRRAMCLVAGGSDAGAGERPPRIVHEQRRDLQPSRPAARAARDARQQVIVPAAAERMQLALEADVLGEEQAVAPPLVECAPGRAATRCASVGIPRPP